MWEPISFEQLYDKIITTENQLMGKMEGFWKLIRIVPEKWKEKDYGEEGGGFWVVAICGRQVIWYNDIEEGFNISPYTNYGEIDEYWCDQLELIHKIIQLYNNIEFGHSYEAQAGPPQNL